MGKSQRQKGTRAELLLRNELRRRGFTAERIPLSGAANGFKGDVTFSKGGMTYKAEVKSRKDEYEKIYQLYEALTPDFDRPEACFIVDGVLIKITDDPEVALISAGTYEFAEYKKPYTEFKSTFKKIAGLRKLLGEADILAIKDDRKPFLYLKFRE